MLPSEGQMMHCTIYIQIFVLLGLFVHMHLADFIDPFVN